MAQLRIALAQIDTTVGDVLGNAEKVLTWARDAADAGAELVVFPEMTLTGYPVEDLALRGSFARAAQHTLDDLVGRIDAAGLGELTVVLGTIGVTDDGRATNRAVVVRGGAVIATHDKHHLPTYEVFDEYRLFAPGDGVCVVDVRGRRVGVVVCEDVWQDDGPVTALAESGVDVLAVLNGSPYEEGKAAVRHEVVARAAGRLDATVAYVNTAGGQDDLVFDGGSFVLRADGEPVARSPQFVEHLLLVDLPDDGPPEHGAVAEALDADAEMWSALVAGLRGYVTKNGFSSVVFGLSGGIDSAVVAAIAADAIGGENVVAVSMPSRWSSEHSKDDAADMARRIGADYRVQPIGTMVEAFEGQLDLPGVAGENLQARVRAVVVMGLSNTEGHLVLAPGNRSELAVGYSTIYGDAVGGYGPIKDVYKSRVWRLARWRNQVALDAGEVPPIPESSITKPPSAELAPGQVDQDSLPPYDVLDPLLEAYVGRSEGRDELIAQGFDADVVDRVVNLVDRGEWKRRQYPPGPKVSRVAFGRDRRLPITSAWRDPKGLDT